MPTRKAPARSERSKAKKAAKKVVTTRKRVAKRAVAKAKAPGKKARAAPAKRASPATRPAPASSSAPAPAPAPAKPGPKRRPPGAPKVERTRVVIAMDVYEPQKDAFKAPLKAAELKWNFLGEGKGLYKRADGGVHCFTQFRDDGVHYSVWGDDKEAVGRILAAWRTLLGDAGWSRATASGEQAAAQEEAQKESEALRLWRMGEPQRRPGEPDLFFQKRMAEWQAKKPA